MKVARQESDSAQPGHRLSRARDSASLRSIFGSVKKPLGLLAVCALALNVPLAQAQDVADDTVISQPAEEATATTVEDDFVLPTELEELLRDPDTTEDNATADPESSDEELAPELDENAVAPRAFAERSARVRSLNPGVTVDASSARWKVTKYWDGGSSGSNPGRFLSAHFAYDPGKWDGSWIQAVDSSGRPNLGLELGPKDSPYYINTDDTTVWSSVCPQTEAYGTCTFSRKDDPTQKVVFTFDGKRKGALLLSYKPGGFTVTLEGFEDGIVDVNEPVTLRLRWDTDKGSSWYSPSKVSDSTFNFEDVPRLPYAPTSAPGRIAQAYLVRGKPSTAPSVLYHTALDGSGLKEIGSDAHWVYNALAYDDITHQLVAISQKPDTGYENQYPAGHLLSINPETGMVTDRGPIQGIKEDDVKGGINTGTMTLDGEYWIANASVSGTGTLYSVPLAEGRPAVARTVTLSKGSGYNLPNARPNSNDYTYVLGAKGKYAYGMVNQLKSNKVSTPTLERITLDGPNAGRIDWFDLSDLSTPAGNKMPTGPGAIYGSAWTEPNGNLVFATNRATDPFKPHAAAFQLEITDPDNLQSLDSIKLVSVSPIPTSENNDATSYRPDHRPDLSVAKTGFDNAVLISDNDAKSYLWRIRVKNEEPAGGAPSSGFILTDTLPVQQDASGAWYSPFKNLRVVDGKALEELRQELIAQHGGDEIAVSEAIKAELKKVPLAERLDPTTPDPAVDPNNGLVLPGMTPRHITCEVGQKPDKGHPEINVPAFTCNAGPLEPQDTKEVIVVADLVGPGELSGISDPACGPNTASVNGLEPDPNPGNNQDTAECPNESIALVKRPAADQDPDVPGDQPQATVYEENGQKKARVRYEIFIKNNGDKAGPITSQIVDTLRIPAGVKVENSTAKIRGEDTLLDATLDPDTKALMIPVSAVGEIPAKGEKIIELEVFLILEDSALSAENMEKLECASATPENLENPKGALNAVRMEGEKDPPYGTKNNNACVTIVNPSAAISKSPSPGEAVEMNGNGEADLTYTVTVTNSGGPGSPAVTVPNLFEEVELPDTLQTRGDIHIEAPATTGASIGELTAAIPAAEWVAGKKLTIAKNIVVDAGVSQEIRVTVPVKLKANVPAEKRRELETCEAAEGGAFTGGVPNSVSMDIPDADGTENNHACIPLKPAEPVAIFLQKVSYVSGDGVVPQPLTGAEFRIEPADNNGVAIVPVAGEGGRFTATLKPGAYSLVETKAPEGGYQLLPGKVPFKLVKDAQGTRLEFQEPYSSPLISFVNDTGATGGTTPTVGIQIADVQTGELPKTGPANPIMWISLSLTLGLGMLVLNLSDIRRIRRRS